jgi:mannose-6-phosphate isomerase-like protein (cupin superfamily)
MRVNKNNINGTIIRDTDVYVVEDNTFLNNLTLSKTTLHESKNTSGHSHEGLEEVYFFYSGTGKMQIDEKFMDVQGGDIVLIPAGAFHKVYNNSDEDLEFVCVFQKYER